MQRICREVNRLEDGRRDPDQPAKEEVAYDAIRELFKKDRQEPPRLPVLLLVVEWLSAQDRRANDVEAQIDRFDKMWTLANNAYNNGPAPDHRP
jgi:hypothetical protein